MSEEAKEVARILFRAFDDVNEGREPLHDFDVVLESGGDGYSGTAENWLALGAKAVELGAHLPVPDDVEYEDPILDDSEIASLMPNHQNAYVAVFARRVAEAQRKLCAVRSKTLLARSRDETCETEHRLEDAVVRANNAEALAQRQKVEGLVMRLQACVVNLEGKASTIVALLTGRGT